MSYRKSFLVEPGQKLRLSQIDPSSKEKHETSETVAAELEAFRQKLTRLQALLYASHKHSLLIVLQAMDAGGKDGTVNHVFAAFNAQGTTVTGFKQPTPVERDHDFLWRVHPHVPGPGKVAIFNRSHYEDVLITRVHKLIDEATCKARYEQIRCFERGLADNGTRILKFFLHISREEQARALRRAPAGPRAQLEDQRVGLHRAGAMGRLHRRLPGRDGSDQHETRSLVRHPC